MRKIYKLVLKAYSGPLVMTFFIALFILLMQFLWKYVDDLVGKGLGWDVIAQLLFYASWTFVPMALPLAILLASLMTFGNLGERYELVAIKAAGISLRKLMLPLIILSIMISVAAFFFSNNVLPYANLKFRSILYDVRQQKLALNIKDGVYYSDIDGYVLRVDKKEPKTGTLKEIQIYDHTKGTGNTMLTLADSGTMVQTSDKQYLILTLNHGYNYDESGSSDSYNKKPFQKTSFDKEVLRFDLSGFKMVRTDEELFKKNYMMLNLNQLQKAVDSLREVYDIALKNARYNVFYSFQDFKQFNDEAAKKHPRIDTVLKNKKIFGKNFKKDQWYSIIDLATNSARQVQSTVSDIGTNLKDQGEIIRKHEVEWWRKFTLSIACLILFFVGAPMGAIIRKGGLGLPLILSVLFFVLYHVISMTGEKAAKAGALSPMTGMWLSSLVLLPTGIYLTYKATTDSPLLDADAYVKGVKRFLVWAKITKEEDNDNQAS
ncbi:MAG: LptF/LptG family permease [Bacteroidota bacterium]|nr:LptF/LptG family permease [Bacteroidota bacterium]